MVSTKKNSHPLARNYETSIESSFSNQKFNLEESKYPNSWPQKEEKNKSKSG